MKRFLTPAKSKILALMFSIVALGILGTALSPQPAHAAGCASGEVGSVKTTFSVSTANVDSYRTWLQLKAGSTAVIGIELDGGGCQTQQVTGLSSSWKWAAIGTTQPLAVGQHTLTVKVYSSGVSLMKGMLLSDACDPNTDSKACTPVASSTPTPTIVLTPTKTPVPANTPSPMPSLTPTPTKTPTPAISTPTPKPSTTPTPVPLPGADVTKPSGPATVTPTLAFDWIRGRYQLTVSWKAATDDRGVSSYELFRNGAKIATTATSTSYSDYDLKEKTSYMYQAYSIDAAGNRSSGSSPQYVNIKCYWVFCGLE